MALKPANTPRKVLIGFADALVAAEVVFSLEADGWRVVAFARRGSCPALRRIRSVELRFITAPEQDTELAAADLRALVQAERFAAIMPLDDASVWLADIARLRDRVVVAGPTGELAKLALDKRLQLMHAKAAGFDLPPGSVHDSLRSALATRRFPCVLKPALAVGFEGGQLVRRPVRLCADRAELEAAARHMPDGPLIVQDLVAGDGEGVFGLARRGDVLALSAHRRVRMMNPEGSGSSACEPIAVRSAVAESVARMMRAVRWDGLFMVELLARGSGEAVFVELNGRPWGSMALARRVGLEYPAWTVSIATGRATTLPSGSQEFVPSLRCRHLGRELVHIMFVLRGPRSKAMAPKSRLAAVASTLSLKRHDRWYNWRRGDVGFFIDDTARTVLDAVRHRAA